MRLNKILYQTSAMEEWQKDLLSQMIAEQVLQIREAVKGHETIVKQDKEQTYFLEEAQ